MEQASKLDSDDTPSFKALQERCVRLGDSVKVAARGLASEDARREAKAADEAMNEALRCLVRVVRLEDLHIDRLRNDEGNK